MQRGRQYPQSLDFWSEPDAPPTARRPLELLTIQWRVANPIDSYTVSNSIGIFDPSSGAYVWLDTVVGGINVGISTIIESIDHTGIENRFDFDLSIPTTGEHFHAHSYTRQFGYPWRSTGSVYTWSVIDANTFIGSGPVDIAFFPRRYF